MTIECQSKGLLAFYHRGRYKKRTSKFALKTRLEQVSSLCQIVHLINLRLFKISKKIEQLVFIRNKKIIACILLEHFIEKLKHISGKLKHFIGKLKHISGKLKHFIGKLKHFIGKLKHFSGN